MKKYSYIILILVFIACERESNKNEDFHVSYDKVSGYVQKGPYINGTAITISELSEVLAPTGRTFSTQILDNKGTYELLNVELASRYAEIKADGYYFDEVGNSLSASQLTLFALTDLTDKSDLNVNVLSHLEKGRVMYLLHEGLSFSAAKKQAQREILSIFEIEKPGMTESELLDISKQGDDNAILLAVSVILQGYLPVSDLSELLANISTDIREDGILNSQTLGTALINNAKNIDLQKIRTNLEKRYETLGMDVTVPAFEPYVTNFIEKTDFEYTGFIVYPKTGAHGLNILDTTNIEFTRGFYSMKAILPDGASLKVKITGGNWYFSLLQQNTGWSWGDWDVNESSRTFTSTKTGEMDFQLKFENESYTIVYDSVANKIDTLWGNVPGINVFVFENNAATPTWTRDIVMKEE